MQKPPGQQVRRSVHYEGVDGVILLLDEDLKAELKKSLKGDFQLTNSEGMETLLDQEILGPFNASSHCYVDLNFKGVVQNRLYPLQLTEEAQAKFTQTFHTPFILSQLQNFRMDCISCAGFIVDVIAQISRQASNIQVITLTNCGLEDKPCARLGELLYDKAHLKELNISFNKTSEESKVKLKQLFQESEVVLKLM